MVRTEAYGMRFAYLIMVHDSMEQLKILLHLLDHEENDIYLHIDKKSDMQEAECCARVSRAHIHTYKEISVYHSDISLSECELFLLREAVKQEHDYYHLISGHDLPIKKHSEIVAFFEANKGKQFIHFESDDFCPKEACIYFHFLYGWMKRHPRSPLLGMASRLESTLLRLQKRLHVHRKLYCGAEWFSITHELAVEFCRHSDTMLRKVRWTIASDELILQTFYRTMASGRYDLFARNETPADYISSARLIDWSRGNPYVWRLADYEEIISSDRMFARKFNWDTDKEIILKIAEHVAQ